MRITPAELAFQPDGTPFSTAYGDVYHSAGSALGQAGHVFLGGNDLPRRWAGRRAFTILETGFGLGTNFLATRQRWRDDPARCGRLHFVSVEKHPLGREDMPAELREAWPPLVPGLHRLGFDEGRVTLTLAFGDAAEVVPRLRLRADAIYLDGFAPRCNPDMWTPRLMKDLARLCSAGATAATYTTAVPVREALAAAGFAVEKKPGFGAKREMLVASFEPRRAPPPPAPSPGRHAIVVGAGLAGAAVADSLHARGWRVDVIAHAAPTGAFTGVFHPHVSPDDAIRSRLLRSGYLHATSRWRQLGLDGWRPCGLLQLWGRAEGDKWTDGKVAALAYPGDYAEFVGRERAEALAGCRLASGGWWFPGAGWAHVAGIADAQLRAVRAAVQPGTVARLEQGDDGWRALDGDGRVMAAAPIVVLANAIDAFRLAPMGGTFKRIRGQVTHLAAGSVRAPDIVLASSGYVTPVIGTRVTVGSTYDPGDDPAPRPDGDAANLDRLSRLLPDAAGAAVEGGAVGFRCVAPDRLPLAGAVPDFGEAQRRRDELKDPRLADLPRRAGLYCVTGLGSHGLVSASLAAETVSSLLEGEPLPLEGDLADAIDPARFVLRALRRGTL